MGFPTAVFASGSGTNLQAVLDRVRAGTLPLEIRLVVSNRPDAFALTRARRAGVKTSVIPFDPAKESRDAYARRLAAEVHTAGARLVLLLGWMHVLAPAFLSAGFDGILNLHPSYLPDDPSANEVVYPDGSTSRVFRGPWALRDALQSGERLTGASLIEITPVADRGPVLARRVFEFEPGDTEASALERIHPVEQAVVEEGIKSWLARRSVGSKSRPLQ